MLRVEVHDGDPEQPGSVTEPPADSESGRGLLLVDVLADRWGVDEVVGGKRLWFELSVAP